LDPIYYLITFACVGGGCYTGFQLGKREGIERFLDFLDSHKNKLTNEVKIKLTDGEVEIIR